MKIYWIDQLNTFEVFRITFRKNCLKQTCTYKKSSYTRCTTQ